MIFEKTLKISDKGQLTLPQQARDALGTETVRLIVEAGVVRIEPVEPLAGSLRRYAERFIPFQTARDQAWSEVIRETHHGD